MTEGIKALRKIQLGKELTSGSAVAATTKWRGLGVLQDDQEVIFPEEDIGYISGVNRSYIASVGGSISFDSVEATFEQLPHILEAGVKLVTTGAADGSGSGKIYSYIMPTTATNTLRTYTIEAGDNIQAEEMAYSYVESFTIEGNANESLMMSAEWKGRQVVTSAFTTAATLPAVEEILFNKGKIYIDAVGGTIGSTQVSNTLISATVDVTTGIKAIATADGNLYFSFTKTTMPEVTLDVTFEHNSSALTEKTAWRNSTPRQIRLIFEGSDFTTAGTTYSKKTFIIDMAGTWESFDAMEDDDGNDTISGTFRARYDSTADLFCEMVVVNALTNLP